jgi:integrase/recombinase XerD
MFVAGVDGCCSGWIAFTVELPSLVISLNLAGSIVRVTHKPDRGRTPKAYKEREIPIPPRLVKSLKAWKAKANKSCNLVFPASGCDPKLHFLDNLKAVAERAQLDPENFWLHKFQATFATRCLWAGVDLRTVQMSNGRHVS